MQALSVATTSSDPQDLGWAVLDAVPPLMWFVRRTMRDHRRGVSMPQFRAMCLVASEPAVSLSVVAEHLAVTLPTASRIVGGLVDKGLLSRKDCRTDRRQVAIGITPRGQSVLDSAHDATQKQLTAKLAGFTPAQRATVVEAMGLVKSVFGSLRLPARSESSEAR